MKMLFETIDSLVCTICIAPPPPICVEDLLFITPLFMNIELVIFVYASLHDWIAPPAALIELDDTK